MKLEKLIQKFKDSPTALRYSEIKKILIALGFISRRGKGSHEIFKKEGCEIVFSLHGKDVKDGYKKMTLKKLQYFNLL
mgnify:CR=1 FL=1